MSFFGLFKKQSDADKTRTAVQFAPKTIYLTPGEDTGGYELLGYSDGVPVVRERRDSGAKKRLTLERVDK